MALMAELPNYWVLAEEVAECVGYPTQVAATILHRAARAGRVEARPEVWRSARSRPRVRHWYRLPEQEVIAFPEWLEPPSHSFDSQRCRLVVGRASLWTRTMNLDGFDRPLRAQFRATTDEEVADHPKAAATRAELERIQAEHASNVASYTRLADLQTRLDSLAVELDEQERAIVEAQVGKAADALLSGRDIRTLELDSDDLHKVRIALRAIPAARERLKRQIQAAQNKVQQSASREANADDALRRVLDELRLDLARSRL